VVRYRSRTQIADEKEELTIAGEFEKRLNIHNLTSLLR